ncbi:tRNA (N6-threonylcarbamoyladenosine(37)-N6)-methyltransferase TrmO [Thalassolituus sp. UBA2009]|uniref:tRNA (N6-threonylcarbamoyladenosine(37)-N6)-methyltransferase TrmO n=1 Tax=Thalassolituus sp. UBA2009 TaxID=1947658 RepID=UPI0025799D47|nr:tRNA (N6-threonylcarbamoyladenosine(37)-N6)-methyltransferase TrmO [Thalassolituus sp. UBA2009]
MSPAAIHSAIGPTSVQPVAIARTPFAEKFAIPRQPQLAPAARAVIELLPPYNQPEALLGLEQVSHIWLLFQFHQAPADDPAAPRLRVRPPRLGGNEKLGVFATRSTHRPNGIGQSVVRLEKVEGTRLWVSGVDLLDGTPIIDIKPYVPYADSIAGADNGIASEAPVTVSVSWQPNALAAAQQQAKRLGEDVVALVEQCLAQDPKPAYQQPDESRRYGVRFWDINVVWHYPQSGGICVLSVETDGAV